MRATADFPIEIKEAFAEAYLRLEDSFKAGCDVFPHDKGKGVQAAHLLSNDPETMALVDVIRREKGQEALLPTRADVARDLYRIGTEEKYAVSDRISALKAFAEMCGYMPKDRSNLAANTINNVMIVNERDAIEWEDKAKQQQKQLIDAARQQ